MTERRRTLSPDRRSAVLSLFLGTTRPSSSVRDHRAPVDVRIRSVDVPRRQWLMARLVLGFTRPRNPILGMELAYVVERVGKDVTRFRVGNEVFGFAGWGFGTYAEYACVRQRPRRSVVKNGMLAMRPANMTLQEAAAGVATGGVTASRVLRKVKIKRGQKVRVRSLRADHVIDYTHQDLADGASYDVVFDAVDKLASSRGKQH